MTENKRIVSIYFDDLLLVLNFSKSFQKCAQKVHFPSTKSIINFFATISENRVYCNNKRLTTKFDACLFLSQLLLVSICHKNKRKRMLSAEYFYHPFRAFSRCNVVVSFSKNSNIILLLLLFSLLMNQFAEVCWGSICLAKLFERYCGDGQEKLYS